MKQASRNAAIGDLGDLLDRVEEAARRNDPTSVGAVMDELGSRSFAPLLLLAGLVMLAPVVGDIPGVPVLMGSLVVLTAGQFLLGRRHVWLPDWLLRRSVSPDKVRTMVRWLRPVGRLLDRWSQPRLTPLVRQGGAYAICVACLLVAATTPVMEVVPFSANLAGAAITAFGLALLVGDGLVALLAIGLSVGAFSMVLYGLL